MKTSINQNRREFFLSSARNGLAAVLGIFGGTSHHKSARGKNSENCPADVTCADCPELGVCPEDKAAERREEVKSYSHTAKQPKGAYYGRS